MDWIEQVLHINPDGGSGIFEATLVALLVAALLTPLTLRATRRRKRHSRS